MKNFNFQYSRKLGLTHQVYDSKNEHQKMCAHLCNSQFPPDNDMIHTSAGLSAPRVVPTEITLITLT